MIPGMVILWYGAIVDIPPLWQLCDGSNGSPDLRDNFVVGAGVTYAVDATGGNVLHNHAFTSDNHFHFFLGGSVIGFAFAKDINTTNNVSTGITNNRNGLPPYHALAYLMRL